MKLSSNKRKLTGDSAAATKEVDVPDVPDTMSIVRWQMTSSISINSQAIRLWLTSLPSTVFHIPVLLSYNRSLVYGLSYHVSRSRAVWCKKEAQIWKAFHKILLRDLDGPTDGFSESLETRLSTALMPSGRPSKEPRGRCALDGVKDGNLVVAGLTLCVGWCRWRHSRRCLFDVVRWMVSKTALSSLPVQCMASWKV